MTKLWRWYFNWSMARPASDYDDFAHRLARRLIGRGLLARSASGSGYINTYEWNWRFWRGAYWRFDPHTGQLLHP